MSKRQPRYDDKFRSSAILLLEAAGWKANGTGTPGASQRTARSIKVPRQTLERWAKGQNNPAPAAQVAETRIDLVEALRSELDSTLGAMAGARSEATWFDLVRGTGILVDKIQLISGQPTGNVKHSGDPDSPITIKAVNYRDAIASLAPGPIPDSDSSGQD